MHSRGSVVTRGSRGRQTVVKFRRTSEAATKTEERED